MHGYWQPGAARQSFGVPGTGPLSLPRDALGMSLGYGMPGHARRVPELSFLCFFVLSR